MSGRGWRRSKGIGERRLGCLGTVLGRANQYQFTHTSALHKRSQRSKRKRERESNIYYISHIFIIYYLHFSLLFFFLLFASTSFYLHFAFCARRKLKTRRAFEEDGRKLLQAAAGENKLKIFIAKIFAGKCQRTGHSRG